jgi:carbamoyltransferase
VILDAFYNSFYCLSSFLKMKYILGINDGHCATACLLKDGEMVGCVSEERFNRQKNWSGFPTASVRWLLQEAGIGVGQVDAVVLNYQHSGILNIGDGTPTQSGSRLYQRLASLYGRLNLLWVLTEYRLPSLRPFSEKLMVLGEKIRSALLSKERLRPILQLGIPAEKIVLADHHTTHIYSLLGWKNLGDEALVITVDGEGDLLSSTVNIWRRGKFERLAQTSRFVSLGLLYTAVTQYMGMKPLEHEYKIMGLAPYCSDYYIEKTLPVFENLLIGKDLGFRSRYRTDLFGVYLQDKLRGHRFDAIAGAVQRHTENLLVHLVKNAIRQTGVHRLALAGGVLMNVKASMLLAALPEVEEIFIFPSAGDESTAIGAAFWYYFQQTGRQPQPIADLYFGPSFDDEVENVLLEEETTGRYRIEKPERLPERVADLLVRGKIVARCAGKMEWGARALGNRSILADPRNPDIVRIINEQIKQRDFWMPFTPSILEERAGDYLVNPKNIFAPYMILAFESTNLARKDLPAAMHPYDFTLRPQVVRQSWNLEYHQIIQEFENRTGVGGVLNTSFNIHGEPIVGTPADALDVFARSGLEYLVLGDCLLAKND